MFSESFIDAAENINPVAREEKNYLPLDLVPHMAKRTITNFKPDTFRAIYKTAIEQGLVSVQEVVQAFGSDIRRKLDKGIPPDPATCREILSFISTFNPEQATGSRLPWRHSQYVPPAAEPTPLG